MPRLAYQAPGAADLHPMDAALNLPRDSFSHGIRRLVAREAAKSSFDEVVETVRELTGASIAKRQVEELTVRAAQDFDAFYQQRAAARDPQDDLLVISTDAKGIVMRHEDLREGTRRAAAKGGRKLETRLTPGEKSNRKRMAQVATVYSIAPFPRGPADILHSLRDADDVDARRPRPTDKRVWASVEKSAATVIREAFAEALRRDHGSSFTAQVAAANGGVMQRLHSFNAKKQFSSGIIEGLNNKAKVTLRKAYGYRTFRIAELSPYHVLGRLPEPKLAHRFV